MPLPTTKQKLIHYPANTQGRDFVVGDIHGMYAELLKLLTLLEFNGEVDRLFSVGDLIDRGPDSKKCAELIYETWFYAVRGNHEQFMIDAFVHNNDSMAASWYVNGGQWAYFGTPDEQEAHKLLAHDLDMLPTVITVGEGDNRFNIVHAELYHRDYTDDGGYANVPITDELIDKWIFSESEENSMLWGRAMISGDPIMNRSHHMINMSPTFVGHTPIREPLQVQRAIYLDGGAVFAQRSLSHENAFMIAEPKSNTLYRYAIVPGTLQAINFLDIDRQM